MRKDRDFLIITKHIYLTPKVNVVKKKKVNVVLNEGIVEAISLEIKIRH